MSGFSGTRLGPAKSRSTLKGHCGVRKTEDGTTKAEVATGGAPVAECVRRLERALIARGVPPFRAKRDAQRVAKLATDGTPKRTARYKAARITRQAIQAAVLA